MFILYYKNTSRYVCETRIIIVECAYAFEKIKSLNFYSLLISIRNSELSNTTGYEGKQSKENQKH